MNHPKKLEEIDLSLPLEGREGLDGNYLTRTRSQYLYAQHQALLTQTQFADAKAAVLITLVGLLAFRGPVQPNGVGLTVFSAIYLGVMALCVICAFIAVFPRYPGKSVRQKLSDTDRWSWPALSGDGISAEEFARFMHTSEASQLVHSVSLSNAAISRILLAKFRMLRIAFLLAIVILLMTGIKISGVI